MKAALSHARLFINGAEVGEIRIHGWEGAWGIGEFVPGERFSAYAVLFGAWSLLMHADDDQVHLSRDAADELRQIERAIDALHIRLRLEGTGEWRTIGQVNIDGHLIEWKEIWEPERRRPGTPARTLDS